jgi:8-oxo-dGTP pyrophosphatase MutT (NUDIX family)
MTRGDVQALLLARRPADAKEEADRSAMLAFLEGLPEPFSRHQPGAHFTASALVVDDARTRTALVHHRKLGLWVQPGGHIDEADASVIAAALREAREETGLDGTLAQAEPLHLDVHEIPERPDMPAHLHLDIRFLVVAGGDLAVSDESLDVRWMSLDEAARRGDESVRRLLLGACIHAGTRRSPKRTFRRLPPA